MYQTKKKKKKIVKEVLKEKSESSKTGDFTHNLN